MDHRTTGESPHELLLALAGRIDDDLLAWCRELVAVGEDGRALELITATLVADRTALPAPVRAAVVAAARPDLDTDAALPAAVPEYGTAHRFGSSGTDLIAAAVGALPARQIAGSRTWVTSRLTPAGAAPGPLPQPVVLVEIGAGDTRPVDVLAYQIAIACARAGVAAAVEVVVGGIVPPEYQQAALLNARPVHEGGAAAPVVAGEIVAAAEIPAVDPPAWPLGSIDVPPASRPVESHAAPVPEPTPEPERIDAAEQTEPDPVPSPVTPLRGLPSTEPAELPRRGLPRRDQPRADPPRPGPGRPPRPTAGPDPVPIGRRNGRGSTAENSGPAAVRSLPVALPPPPDSPALASLGDPLSGPIESAPRRAADDDDPLGIDRLPLPPEDRAPTTSDPEAWLVDWITGDWAMPPAETTAAGQDPNVVAPVAAPRPVVDPTPIAPPRATAPHPAADRVEIDRVDPPPPRPGRRRAAPPGPAAVEPPESATEPTELVLRPESVTRLSDADRELLARLQSDAGGPPRPRMSRHAGIAGESDETPHDGASNGHGPRPS